jgi:hypothetical protein
MYPAFLKALYYEPNTKPALSDKGIAYFGVGNWYVPDSRELERMIYYRINSAIENGSLSEEAWNSTVSVNKDVSGKKLNVFTPNTFSAIAFLKDSGSQISAVGNNEGESLAYGEVWWDGNNTPGWH